MTWPFAYLLVSSTDVVCTIVGTQQGLAEANPLGKLGLFNFLVVKILICTVLAWLWEWTKAKYLPRYATAVTGLVVVSNLALIASGCSYDDRLQLYNIEENHKPVFYEEFSHDTDISEYGSGGGSLVKLGWQNNVGAGYVNLGHPAGLETLSAGTVVVWFTPLSAINPSVITSKTVWGKGNLYFGFYNETGLPWHVVIYNAAVGAGRAYLGHVLKPNIPVMMSVTWGEGDKLRLFIDRFEETNAYWPDGYSYGGAGTDWRIANLLDSSSFGADTITHAFGVWDRVLSGSEIIELESQTSWRYQ